MSDEQSEMTTEQMKELLRAEQQKRINDCNNELQELLRKYNCRIEAQFVLSWDGTVRSQLMILPNQDIEQ